MKLKHLFLFVIVFIAAWAMSGCYWMRQVNSFQVGVVLDDGVTVSNIVGPGRYGNGGFYADLKQVDTSIKTSNWEDPSLVTSDNQPIGLKLAISYRRKSDSPSVMNMFKLYNAEMFNDEIFKNLIMSRVPDAAKGATAKMSLNEMLKDRNTLSGSIKTDLTEAFTEIFSDCISVQVLDISVDPDYEAKLKQKAQVILDRDIAKESVSTAEENLKKTKAETEIQLELARRQNAVNEQLAKVYENNPRFYELKRLEALQGVIGPNAKIVFVPEGSSLSVINTDNNSAVVPVR